MNKYCIFILLDTPELPLIESIRKTYDPLALLVPAHLTLVFPFETNIEIEQIILHLNTILHSQSIIKAMLTDIYISEDKYIHLKVEDDGAKIYELHTRLYSGLLHGYLNTQYKYSPHVTLGRITADHIQIVQNIKDTIQLPQLGIFRKVILEKILDDNSSKIETLIELN